MTYAKSDFELVEELSRRTDFAFARIFQALADTFLRIGAGGNIQRALVGFGILNSRFLSLYRKRLTEFDRLRLLHEFIIAAKKS
jgi:hypothetical protein